MKIPLILIVILFSGYVISNVDCRGNCSNLQGGMSCQLNPALTCTVKESGVCNKIWNSSGRIIFGPGRSTVEWRGFLSQGISKGWIVKTSVPCPF